MRIEPSGDIVSPARHCTVGAFRWTARLECIMNAGDLGNLGNLLTGIGTSILAVGTIAAALIAVNSYRVQVALNRSSNLEQRGRWLMDLQKQFIADPTFQLVRKLIYDERCSGSASLTKALTAKNALLSASDPERVKLPPLTDGDKMILVALDGYL